MRPLTADTEAARRASDALRWEQESLDTAPRHEAMREARRRLPAYGSREALLGTLVSSRVIVVCGETGCGKSTQVPQYLLEEECRRGRGGACKIVVTQPRRIAAIALAERVAVERGGRPGGTVGYAVRLESRASSETRLLYCTTGVLLAQLRDDPTLQGASHVIVDEVHERSLDSDVLLIVLRDALAANPALRVVLMSATVNADQFRAYFEQPPAAPAPAPDADVADVTERRPRPAAPRAVGMLSIPGRTFPIDDFSLEDAIEVSGYVARGKVLLRGDDADEELAPLRAANALESRAGGAGGSEAGGDAGGGGGDAGGDGEEAEAGGDGSEAAGKYSVRTREALRRLPSAAVPAELVALLLARLDADDDANGAERGAALVFLPGVPEIRRMCAELERSPGASRWLLLPLHGELPAAEQRRVFGAPPRGARKVILSTNVAETSLTIDDVTVVLDTGRVKQSTYDALNCAAQLIETWAPRSSRRQRRGRAGRTRRGQYWALYSRAQERRLAEEAPPEILRVPLENVYLQMMAMGYADGDARAFLRKALQPPTPAALDAASLALRRVGALVGGDVGTPPAPPPQKLDRRAEERLGKWIAAKKARDFAAADKLRAELRAGGVDAEAAARERVAAERETTKTDAAAAVAAARSAAGSSGDGSARAAAGPPAVSPDHPPAPSREALTPLGLHLARMPLDARIGKVLIYGALLGCYEPALTLAAAMSLARSPFLSPMDKRQEAQAARAPFCKERSDHMALLRAYEGWAAETAAAGGGAARRYAERHYLSANGMEELHAMRRTLAASLADIGFATKQPGDGAGAATAATEGHTNIVRALLCAGLYPNVARIRMPDQKYVATAQGAVEAVNDEARAVRFYEVSGPRNGGGGGGSRAGGARVFLHPSCVLFGESTFEHARWLCFTSKQRVGGPSGGASAMALQAPATGTATGDTGKTYVRDVTAVSPLALLLFGGDVEVHHDKSTVTIDGEITFEAPGQVAVLVRELRSKLDMLLRDKIASPTLEIASHPVMSVIVNLITTEKAGFS